MFKVYLFFAIAFLFFAGVYARAQTEVILNDSRETVEKTESAEKAILQHNESNLDFIRESAGREGTAENAESIKDGDSNLTDQSVPVLINVNRVQVRGWDPEKKEEFLRTVKARAEVRSEQDLENFAAGVLLKDENIEGLEITHEGLKMRYNLPAKIFGWFDVSLRADAEVSAGGRVKVKFPWYGFLYKQGVSAAELEVDIQNSLAADLDDWTVLSADNAAKTAGIIENIREALLRGYDKSHRLLRGN